MLRRRCGTRDGGMSMMFRPATHTAPRSGRSCRLSRRNMVLLPEPEGPTRKTNSPLAMSKLASRRATTSAAYDLVTFSRRIIRRRPKASMRLPSRTRHITSCRRSTAPAALLPDEPPGHREREGREQQPGQQPARAWPNRRLITAQSRSAGDLAGRAVRTASGSGRVGRPSRSRAPCWVRPRIPMLRRLRDGRRCRGLRSATRLRTSCGTARRAQQARLLDDRARHCPRRRCPDPRS